MRDLDLVESARLLAGSERELAELRLHACRRCQDHRRHLRLEDEHVERLIAARTAR